MQQTVVVGMSGGVDSSVCAALLQQQGYRVIGVTMQIWQDEAAETIEENGGCCGLSAVEDARRVCDVLGIPHYVVNFKDAFKDCVIDYFVDSYLQGKTPNPCIECNRKMKWELLLQRAKEIGADYIATGHYARIDTLPNGRLAIRNSVTAKKDQTYALYQLSQEQLSKTLLPVGAYTKEEVRELALQFALPVAHKSDSQDICFVPDGDYGAFIEGYLEERSGKAMPDKDAVAHSAKPFLPGNFVDKNGRILGRHKGILHYTIGQRRGLDLPMGRRVFVTEIRPDTNEVVIGENEELFTDTVVCRQLSFMAMADLQAPKEVFAKVRYNHAGALAIIERTGEDEITAHFKEPVRAATPGQAMVFYEGEYVCGGGIIV